MIAVKGFWYERYAKYIVRFVGVQFEQRSEDRGTLKSNSILNILQHGGYLNVNIFQLSLFTWFLTNVLPDPEHSADC